MKNKLFFPYLLLFGLLVTTGCKKFLDRQPLQATLDDLKVGGIEGQIFGLYGTLRDQDGGGAGIGFNSLGWMGMHALRSDDQEVIADPTAGTSHAAFDEYGYNKDLWASNSYWDDHYKLINLANTAIQTADTLKLTDPSSLTNVGEAKFLRAFSYFDLVRSYGRVPKIDFRVFKPEDAQIKKVDNESEIFALIDADLTFAESNLPFNWNSASGISKYPGRITSGAAKTLHAKTYLWRKQWAQALGLCNSIMSSVQYNLHSPYWEIWKTSQENNEESIFEIQALQTAGAKINYYCYFATSQGIRGPQGSEWDLGWGWNTPTQAIVDAYEAGDPRKNATILVSGQSDGGPTTGGYGKILPDKSSLSGTTYWNKKCYADPAEQAAIGTPHGNGFANMRVYRYADVILMAAEAANESGDGATAATLLEKIRARARNGNSGVLPYIAFTSQTQMRNAIKHERRIEFALEGERFFDLVRWGDADAVLQPLGYIPKNHY